MGSYCSTDVIRAITGLSSTEISDTELEKLASFAVEVFNSEVNIDVGAGDEEFEVLSPAAEDVTDTMFYTKHRPLADRNGDGVVTEDDVEVYDDMKTNLPNAITVSSVDAKTGKITLSAIQSQLMYIRYAYSPFDYDSQEMKSAFAYLVAMMVMDAKMKGVESISGGGASVTRRNFFETRWLSKKMGLTMGVSGFVSDAPTYIQNQQQLKEEPRGYQP